MLHKYKNFKINLNIPHSENERLSISHDPAVIEKIESEFLQLRRRELPLGYQKKGSFKACWDSLTNSYDYLRCFCGGLATVFASTATVESDFSLIRYEADDGTRNLSKLSLAGLLHAKQWAAVRRLKVD